MLVSVSGFGPSRWCFLSRLDLEALFSMRCRRQEKLRAKSGADWCRVREPLPRLRESEREKRAALSALIETQQARKVAPFGWPLGPPIKKKQATLSHLPSLFLSSLLFLLLLFTLKSNAIQVAVQLPMFNERAVCQAIIDSACEMAWPRERFCVQVRRDSFFDGSDFSSCAGRWSTLFCDVSACLTSRRVKREGRASVKGGSLLVLGRAKMSFRFHR